MASHYICWTITCLLSCALITPALFCSLLCGGLLQVALPKLQCPHAFASIEGNCRVKERKEGRKQSISFTFFFFSWKFFSWTLVTSDSSPSVFPDFVRKSLLWPKLLLVVPASGSGNNTCIPPVLRVNGTSAVADLRVALCPLSGFSAIPMFG